MNRGNKEDVCVVVVVVVIDYLVYLPKFCMTIVFDSQSWDDCNRKQWLYEHGELKLSF